MDYFLLLPKSIIWWYNQGLEDFFKFFKALLKNLVKTFSIKTLILTLFSPWKRMVGERQRGLDGLKDWLIDNLAARLAGFMVRIFMIAISLILLVVYGIVFVIALGFWLLFPLIVLLAFFNIFLGII
jgi:hypothetical protein